MVYWNGPNESQCCQRCGHEITLKSTCIVGPDHDESWPKGPTMRVTLECSSDCYQFGFPLGPLEDPDGTAIEKRDVPEEWIPDTFVEAIR